MAVATEKRRLLWLGQEVMPANVTAAIRGGWDVLACPTEQAAVGRLDEADLAVIGPPADGRFDPRRLADLLDRLDRSGTVAVVLLPPDVPDDSPVIRRRGQYLLTRSDASPAELAARIEAAASLQPAIRNLQADVAAVRGFTGGAARDFEQLDEEMRLAARLQRDFLPRTLPQVGPIRFATLFRPAGWVSGDIYDVFRLDEDHIGFYIADVVGHGMPAALLTLFIKKSLQTKRILGNTYQIVPPDVALRQLNDDICQQGLSSCQFCTAVYGVVNARTLVLRYARGGHPAPLLLRADGSVRKLDAAGMLLGVFPGETFEARELTLEEGDRLVAFSDGAEETLTSQAHPGESVLPEVLRALRGLPPETAALRLTARIDERRAADPRPDDVTVLILDVGHVRQGA